MIQTDTCAVKGFSLSDHARTVTGILLHPRRFFADLPDSTVWQALGFLVGAAALHSAASLIHADPTRHLVLGVIHLVNAVGMALMMAGLGYALMLVLGAGRARFDKLLSVYAFASGLTLLVAWIPSLLVLSEIWKWWLIGTGMTTALGFKWYRALAVIGLSIVITVLLFSWLLGPGAPLPPPADRLR